MVPPSDNRLGRCAIQWTLLERLVGWVVLVGSRLCHSLSLLQISGSSFLNLGRHSSSYLGVSAGIRPWNTLTPSLAAMSL